jgi:mRNA-degrading endonuclease RelE of RelBE toxin-antitoxin system
MSTSPLFRLLPTSGYKHDVRKLTERSPRLLARVVQFLDALENDPTNQTGHHDIKKLTAVKHGEGQWRIRSGDYRLRYDIFGTDVVLYSFRHRKEAY